MSDFDKLSYKRVIKFFNFMKTQKDSEQKVINESKD